MIVEYIRYKVDVTGRQAFQAAYQAAGVILDADTHCLGWELTAGIEEPQHFVVRIIWDSLEGHEQGFRRSPRFGEFFAAVRPFFNQIQEMKHYSIVREQSAI